jgi:hypothetical protein
MAAPGRPRVTPEELRERIAAYCARYGVPLVAVGIPPFPSGRRETAQHRDWLKLYKVHDRIARRERRQCERCSNPVRDDASVFCEAHHASASSPGAESAAAAVRSGRCPICLEVMDASGEPRGRLHPRCQDVVDFIQGLGPRGLDRIQKHLAQPASAPVAAKRASERRRQS